MLVRSARRRRTPSSSGGSGRHCAGPCRSRAPSRRFPSGSDPIVIWTNKHRARFARIRDSFWRADANSPGLPQPLTEGLDAARARGRTGGRKPKLSAAKAATVRRMYQATGPDGMRLHTVAEIAQAAGVHRTTVYDYLKKEG